MQEISHSTAWLRIQFFDRSFNPKSTTCRLALLVNHNLSTALSGQQWLYIRSFGSPRRSSFANLFNEKAVEINCRQNCKNLRWKMFWKIGLARYAFVSFYTIKSFYSQVLTKHIFHETYAARYRAKTYNVLIPRYGGYVLPALEHPVLVMAKEG